LNDHLKPAQENDPSSRGLTLSRTEVARWGIVLICGVLGVLAEVYLIAVRAPGRVRAAGQHQVVVGQFGSGAQVRQTFQMQAGGLNEIRVLLHATAPAQVVVAWTFHVLDGTSIRGRRRLDLPRGQQWLSVPIPNIADSAGEPFFIDLELIRPRDAPAQPVGLVASEDDALRDAVLSIDGREQWGDLVFEARADGDTMAGRFALAAHLPGVWGRPAIWLIAFNLIVGAFVAGYVPRRLTIESRPSGPRRSRAISIGLLAALCAALAGTVTLGRARDGGIDLAAELYHARMEADLRLHWAFDIRDTDIGGDVRKVISAHPTSRIAWDLDVPQSARLRTWLGMDPTAWTRSEDGVVFRIAVEQDGQSRELLSRHLDPGRVAGDRRWVPVEIDLSAYGGRQATLIFTTEPSVAGAPPNSVYDWALWANPAIVGGR
jgi:hypothetical protein